MNTQSELSLEAELVKALENLGYAYVSLKQAQDLWDNLQTQLEKHNNLKFSEAEFNQVRNLLSKGTIFEKAKLLRQRLSIKKDNGENLYFDLLNSEHWCQNQYQVAQQISQVGKYANRYDLILLINGLPLVQIELKRRGVELKKAFEQINSYQRQSYASNGGLFQYVQIFVISNGVNTKYFANNPKQSFQQTFFWTDAQNKRLNQLLQEFTPAFLEPCHLSKMICKYIVLNETHRIPMILRPYQYYAVEALIHRAKNKPKQNGYVWHTTGSGKTLTSFKASQILTAMPEIDKVVFVVDRRDLDYQTVQEFNSFQKGSVEGTNHTNKLIQQLSDFYDPEKPQFKPITKLVVTTIQKLGSAIRRSDKDPRMASLKGKRIVFIFDECHRSQFGQIHEDIKRYFDSPQMFGFTGTPIFEDNAQSNHKGKQTTKNLFHDCLHKYLITDAIKDENVLSFSVEYVGRYRQKETANEIDIEVEDIDVQELMQDERRLSKIADFIIANHDRKTKNKKFSAIFCVDSVKSLIKYYDIFEAKKQAGQHELKIATIFSYSPHEALAPADGSLPEEVPIAEEAEVLYGLPQDTRDKLESFIADYNQSYGTNFSTKSNLDFYNYYNDISKKLKERERDPEVIANRIDILLVVNMFLTGFDAKKVNTLYVDKNLKYHGLIQAYSRTNRILNDHKTQGNIVVFRNLKKITDEAITLFSNPEAIEVVLMKPYEDYVSKFNQAYQELLALVPTVEAVDKLLSEDQELAFIQAFRKLIRIKTNLNAFSDFDWEDFNLSEQTFEDYKSKYLDLYDKVKRNQQKEKVSILNDVDFQIDLIHRDEINVRYIINLLVQLKAEVPKKVAKAEAEIFALLSSESSLRSKRELIERFLRNHLDWVQQPQQVAEAFQSYWEAEQDKALQVLVLEEGLDLEATQQLIEEHLTTLRPFQSTSILGLLLAGPPSILKREEVRSRITRRLQDYIETFIEGMG